MKTRSFHLVFLLLPAWLAVMGFSACENDLGKINKMMISDTLPVESAKDIELIYSDSARVVTRLESPLLNRYEGKSPYMEFPQGVKVVFYERGLAVKSVLTCLYARIDEKTKIMEARKKVEIVNEEKQEKLNTERLVWDERRGTIYTDEYVRITTPDKVLYGQGFESDQSFDRWTIRRPTGSFSVDKDE